MAVCDTLCASGFDPQDYFLQFFCKSISKLTAFGLRAKQLWGTARDRVFPAPAPCAGILRLRVGTKLRFRSDSQFAHNRIEVCL